MPDRTSLTPLNKSEFVLGQATPRSIYDRHGKLLLASGVIIETQHQLNSLFDQGYIQRNNWEAPKESKQDVSKASTNGVASSNSTTSQMDDVRWYVGEPLHMQALNDPNNRFVVKLIGYAKGKSILVNAPFIDGKYLLIRDGLSFVVRVFQGKKAFAFTVNALKSVYQPYPYLHLSYPKEIISSLIRHDARAAVSIDASLVFNTPHRISEAILTDLSLGGASGITRHAPSEKKETGIITFKISVVGYEELMSIIFVVRSVTLEENGLDYRYGFEFLNVPPQYKLILSAFVHQTIAEFI